MCQRCEHSVEATASTSHPVKKPTINRRRYCHRRLLSECCDDSPDKIKIDSTGHLIFPLGHSWFKGTISTDDDSSYTLNGEFVADIPEDDENNNVTKVNTKGYYRITLFDHCTGTKHNLPKLYVRAEQQAKCFHLLESLDGNVKFTVDMAYRGMKAEVEMHKLMGTKPNLGFEAFVYTGKVYISQRETCDEGRCRAWSC